MEAAGGVPESGKAAPAQGGEGAPVAEEGSPAAEEGAAVPQAAADTAVAANGAVLEATPEVPATAVGSSSRSGGRSGSSSPNDELRAAYRKAERLHQPKAEKELQWQKDKDHQPLREEQQCHKQPPSEIYRHRAGPFRASCHRGQHIRCPEDGRSAVSAMELCLNASDGFGHEATTTAALSGCTAPATVHDSSNESCATQGEAAKEERAAAHESIKQLQLPDAGCQAPGHRLERAWRERVV
ncbi:uncharacterized protein LOC110182070 isoform X2 [Drosophila serrata]|uniref:uncharacterized protein LOC110182070 isoform X2 n=1 Tax=Drosophila serrata TaxID=7274 RepID=UPI000A1D0EB6|nr:uncharacterized protein LOC110182070 isoform X2 [Drosophila serrata]